MLCLGRSIQVLQELWWFNCTVLRNNYRGHCVFYYWLQLNWQLPPPSLNVSFSSWSYGNKIHGATEEENEEEEVIELSGGFFKYSGWFQCFPLDFLFLLSSWGIIDGQRKVNRDLLSQDSSGTLKSGKGRIPGHLDNYPCLDFQFALFLLFCRGPINRVIICIPYECPRDTHKIPI